METGRAKKRVFTQAALIMIVMIMVGFFWTGRKAVHAESYHNYYIYDSAMISALTSWNSSNYHLSFSKGENVEATTRTSSGKAVYGVSTSLKKEYSYGIKIHYGNRTTDWTRGIYSCDTTIGDGQLSYIRTGETSFVVIVGNRKLIVNNGRKTYTQPSKYTCTFNTGGVGKIKASSYVEGRVINLADYTPKSKYHFRFDGWYLDAQFTRRVNYVSLRKNITLYAKWLIPKTVRRVRIKSPMENLKISWGKKDATLKKYNIKGYQVCVTTARDLSTIIYDRTFKKNKTSFNVNVAPGTYYVWIRYYSGAVVSDWVIVPVTVKPFYTAVTEARAPKLKKAKTEKNRVIVSWKKPKTRLIKKYSITGYEVQYSTDPEFKENVKTKTLKKKRTSFKFKGQRKTRYYVRMRYIGAAGASPWSNVRTVRVRGKKK